MPIKKLRTKKKGGVNEPVSVNIFNTPKEFHVEHREYIKNNILINQDANFDYLLLLYDKKEEFIDNSQKNYIIYINIFKNLIADKYILDISDINTSNDKLIFSYIINNIIFTLNFYIKKQDVVIRDTFILNTNLEYFKNIQYNIKKILDIINNYIKSENNTKIDIQTYDINNLIIKYFKKKNYHVSLPLSSENFNEILLEIFIDYILNASNIFLNFGNIIKFSITNTLLNRTDINKVIYLNNDKIVFDLYEFLQIYKLKTAEPYADGINVFLRDIDDLKKRLRSENKIEITDIVINKYNERININFLSIYILLFKDDEINKANASDKIIKELESLIINSDIINKPENYVDNYYIKNFGQEKLFNTVEEVYTNLPNDIYKENINISFKNIVYKEVVRFDVIKYRINTRATFINIIISELEKQQIYYTYTEIEDFIKLDSENIVIIKNTINNIILFLLLDIIFNTFYSNNIKSDIYDNIIYLYIYIDIYKNLVFTDDTNVIDLKKSLGKYLYNRYYNNYNYIVLYSNNYENNKYDVIYIYKEDIVLLEDENNNIIDIDATYNKYFENFKERLNKILSSEYYFNDTQKLKINLNTVINTSQAPVVLVGIAGGAREIFLNMFTRSNSDKGVVDENKENKEKKEKKEKIDKLVEKSKTIIKDEEEEVKQLQTKLQSDKTELNEKLTEIDDEINKIKNINELAIKKKTSQVSDQHDTSDELIGLKSEYEIYKKHYENYTRKMTDTREKIKKLKETISKEQPNYKDFIKSKISKLFEEIEEINDKLPEEKIDDIKINLKQYFSSFKYSEILQLIEDCGNIHELKALLSNSKFDNDDILFLYHQALYDYYKKYRNNKNKEILEKLKEYKISKNKLKEENKRHNEIRQIIVYDNTDIINIFFSIINLVKNKLNLIHNIDIIDDDIIGIQKNIIYRQNDNWVINLSNIILNQNRRIKSGIAESKDFKHKVTKFFEFAYSKVIGKKPKKVEDRYISQKETNDDDIQIYLTFGPPLLLRTQYTKKGGDSKHNYTIEKSSINKKGGRIIENNYNTAAYKIAVKLFKLTNDHKITFVFRETTKNSDKNIYKYKAELKINKKTNKKEIKLKEISDKKKI